MTEIKYAVTEDCRLIRIEKGKGVKEVRPIRLRNGRLIDPETGYEIPPYVAYEYEQCHAEKTSCRITPTDRYFPFKVELKRPKTALSIPIRRRKRGFKENIIC